MNQFKRAELIMLGSDNKPKSGDLILRHIWKNDPKLECKSLWQYKDTEESNGLLLYTTLNGSFMDIDSCFKTQYLYTLTSEPFKEGEWFYNHFYNVVCKFDKTINFGCDKDERCKKVTSSNDPLLNDLPQLSSQFISDFTEEFKKDNIITEVLVEYVEDYQTFNDIPLLRVFTEITNGIDTFTGYGLNGDQVAKNETFDKFKDNWKVKINPNDNTINARKFNSKDIWNRSEVKQKMKDAIAYALLNENLTLDDINQWVEENLWM